MDGPKLSSDLDPAQRHVGQTFKYESSDIKGLHDDVDTSTTYSEMSLQTEVGTLKLINSESMANNPLFSHKNSDLPNGCDIEAMIPQLDLEYAKGSCIIGEGNKLGVSYYVLPCLSLLLPLSLCMM